MSDVIVQADFKGRAVGSDTAREPLSVGGQKEDTLLVDLLDVFSVNKQLVSSGQHVFETGHQDPHL